MTQTKVNTATSMAQSKVSDAELNKQVKALNVKFRNEKKEKVSFPVGMKKNLGPSVFLGINGSSIVVPVDGEDHLVPATFAKQAKQLIKTLTT